MRHVVKDLEQADGVELTVLEQAGTHHITDDLFPHSRRRVSDRRLARLNATHRGVSLCQSLLEKEPITAPDFEQRILMSC